MIKTNHAGWTLARALTLQIWTYTLKLYAIPETYNLIEYSPNYIKQYMAQD